MKWPLGFAVSAFALLSALFAWAHWPSDQLPATVQVDRVIVYKDARRMQLLTGQKVLREYRISLGANPLGHKQREGDERTPEGIYTLDGRNSQSIAYLSMHVSYPDEGDRKAAFAAGRNPGGMIMVHGIRNGLGWTGRMHRFFDWTDGCIAITNAEMTEFWRVVATGTPIEIRP
jgi:murein L,D-transpeptidase YafK